MSEIFDNLNRDDLLDIFKSVSDYVDSPNMIDDTTKSTSPTNPSPVGSVDDICVDCQSESLVYEDGAYFCHLCGKFQEIRINQEQEWRFYGDSDNKSSDPTRVGMPMNSLLPESSLGTMISQRGGSSHDYDKIRQYHTWNTMPYKERSLYRIYERLQNKAIKAGIPPCIIENAKAMYKKLSEAQISRGSNRRGLMGSCVYISCKMEKVPRSAKEIADIYDLKVSEMTKGCKKFMEIMNLTKTRQKYAVSSSTPLHYIHRFSSKLALTKDVFHLCEYIAYQTGKLDIVDENTPPSIAAGSIFLVISLCNLHISKKTVAQVCKISEVTISKCFKKLFAYRKQLFPPSAIARYGIKVD